MPYISFQSPSPEHLTHFSRFSAKQSLSEQQKPHRRPALCQTGSPPQRSPQAECRRRAALQSTLFLCIPGEKGKQRRQQRKPCPAARKCRRIDAFRPTCGQIIRRRHRHTKAKDIHGGSARRAALHRNDRAEKDPNGHLRKDITEIDRVYIPQLCRHAQQRTARDNQRCVHRSFRKRCFPDWCARFTEYILHALPLYV